MENFVRLWILLLSAFFGFERLLLFKRSLATGVTRVRNPLGNKYSRDPRKRGFDISREEQPIYFYFLISLWFAIGVLCLGLALLVFASAFYPPLLPMGTVSSS